MHELDCISYLCFSQVDTYGTQQPIALLKPLLRFKISLSVDY
jgi:hypothetical protein